MTARRQRPGRTTGSVSIEAVLIIPAFLLFVALIAAIGRTAGVQEEVHAAAVEAARVASLASSAATGESAGRAAVLAHLAQDGVNCLSLVISINSQSLDRPPGQPGTVTASVTCVVPLADLAVPGLPGQVTIADSFSTPIDPYTLH